MADKQEGIELLWEENTVLLPLRFDAGRYGSRFYAELRDHKRIFACRCPQCGRLSVPPRPYCGVCKGKEMTEWVEQGDEGILENAQVQYYEYVHPRLGKPIPIPWAHGIIRLNGGALVAHRVHPPDPEKLKVGTRYQAVWKEEGRKGEFHDILYFAQKEDQTPDKLPQGQPQQARNHSIVTKLEVPYIHSAGVAGSRFLIELRDNQKITGTRCGSCNRVHVPAMSICDQCFKPVNEWVELAGKGTLASYAVVHKSEQAHPVPAPFAYGIIKLDGADTALCHLLGEVALDKIEMGMRVEPVFRDERKGSILDIRYFKPC